MPLAKPEMNPTSQLTTTDSAELERRFQGYERLTVRQRKKWLEILLSFETKNSYEVFDQFQRSVLQVTEVGSGVGEFLRRLLLGPMRPLNVDVNDSETGTTILRLHRPWRFFLHRLEVQSPDGRVLGSVQRVWSWLRRIYVVQDQNGQELATLFGPLLKPWTFEIQDRGTEVGSIRKRWSGLGKEMFTDADNFGVDMQQVTSPLLRALVFSATVLIDVVHFERRKG